MAELRYSFSVDILCEYARKDEWIIVQGKSCLIATWCWLFSLSFDIFGIFHFLVLLWIRILTQVHQLSSMHYWSTCTITYMACKMNSWKCIATFMQVNWIKYLLKVRALHQECKDIRILVNNIITYKSQQVITMFDEPEKCKLSLQIYNDINITNCLSSKIGKKGKKGKDKSRCNYHSLLCQAKMSKQQQHQSQVCNSIEISCFEFRN